MLKEEIEEKLGWLEIVQKSMDRMWDNKRDEEVWKLYL